MIYVSQGHELGIGLEVFFRSLAFFSKPEQRKFTLIIETNEAKKYQAFLESTAIHLYTFKKSQKSLTAESLIIALEKIKAKDILITLPTSKDQLVINSTQHFGYTDFFRNQFKTSLPMCFKFNHTYYAILTDHIPLKKVSDEIDLASTQEKIEVLRSGIHKYYGKLDDIYLMGLNPHCGERGLFGYEEEKIHFKVKNVNKVIPADAHHNHLDSNRKQLFIFNYHDQGLVAFKQIHGFLGINITFGMPFLRLSVDHGTNFGHYQKNISNISGIVYVMAEALRLQNI